MSESPQPLTEADLVKMMHDERYWDVSHPEHVSYHAEVAREFRRTYGDGPAPVDATGRLITE